MPAAVLYPVRITPRLSERRATPSSEIGTLACRVRSLQRPLADQRDHVGRTLVLLAIGAVLLL